MVAETVRDALHMIRYPMHQYVGNFLIVFEPEYSGKIDSIPVISSLTSLVPISLPIHDITRNLNVRTTLKEGEVIQSFLFETETIILARVASIRACHCIQCDSQHDDQQCTGNVGSRKTNLCISALLSVPNHAIFNVRFTSVKLASYFISEEALCSSKLSVREVRLCVRRVLDYYSERNIAWLVSGWFKRSFSEDGTPASDVNLHISFVRPKTVLVDAPVLTLEQ